MSSVPDFKLMVIGDVAIVIDLNLGNKSVTNGIEFVITVVNIAVNLKDMRLIYRDSMGIYSRVRLSERCEFVKFSSFGLCHDPFEALEFLDVNASVSMQLSK